MSTITKAISYHLRKHGIKHDTYWESIGIYPYRHAREYIITILFTSNIVKLTDFTGWGQYGESLNHITLDLADPNLLPTILGIAQRCQHKYSKR